MHFRKVISRPQFSIHKAISKHWNLGTVIRAKKLTPSWTPAVRLIWCLLDPASTWDRAAVSRTGVDKSSAFAVVPLAGTAPGVRYRCHPGGRSGPRIDLMSVWAGLPAPVSQICSSPQVQRA